MDKWVVVSGDVHDGIHSIAGPFDSEEAAESYMYTYNMGHYSKAVHHLIDVPE